MRSSIFHNIGFGGDKKEMFVGGIGDLIDQLRSSLV
jgi:hypothetical protein